MTGLGRLIRRKKAAGRYKTGLRRTEWKHGHSREASVMVKGTNKRVIVVESPDPKVFEEAIFVLKEDYVRRRGADQVLEEARRAAGDYLRRSGAAKKRPAQRLWGAVLAAAGVLAAGVAWLTLRLAGIL